MKKLILCLLALATFLTSCKKDKGDPSPSPQSATTDYYKLQTGNYWVYERWKVDTNGVETNFGTLDSTYILADTTVNGTTYYDYRYSLASTFPNWIRDSSGYLVAINGEILCTPSTNTSVFRTGYIFINQDTVADLSYYMTQGTINVSVPAGNFLCAELNVAYLFRPPFNTTLNNGSNPKIFNDAYAAGTGKVRYSYYYASLPYKTECRLLRYFVQ